MRQLIRKFIYRDNKLSKLLYSFVYREWLKRYNEKKGFVLSSNVKDYLPESNIIQYRNEEQISFVAPRKTSKATTPRLMDFYVDKVFVLPPSTVYIYDQAYLIGPEAVGLTLGGEIISDTALDEPVVLHKCSPKLLMRPNTLPIEETVEWCVSLVHIFSSNTYTNYFHWLMDSLILLEAVDFLKNKYGQRIRLIVNKNRASFQNEYLKLLGYESEDLIEWDFQKILVNNLIVVGSRRIGVNKDEIISRHGLNWLKTRLIDSASQRHFGDKIYITRKNNDIRKVVNEHEVESYLKGRGFETVDLDDLNVKDQIKLFKDAQVVVSPHGAGLANIIYSKNLKVVELIGNVDNPRDYYWYAAYYSIANVLDFDYGYLECEALPIHNRGKVYKQIYKLKVPLSGLKELLADL